MIDRRRGDRRARGVAAVLVAAMAALAALVAGPTPASPQPAIAQAVVGAATASAAHAQARVVPVLRAVRAVSSHRHGPLPVPATLASTAALTGLVAVALLLAVVASPPARRTAGAARVRAPPAVA